MFIKHFKLYFTSFIILLWVIIPIICFSQDNCLDDSCNAYIKTKANRVFYVGTYSSIDVAFRDSLQQEYKVTDTSNSIRITRNGWTKDGIHYSIYALKPRDSLALQFEFDNRKTIKYFDVKRIPNPVAQLWVAPKEKINYGCGKAAGPGLIAAIKNFDYEARCNIHSYDLTRITKLGKRVSAHNRGGRFSGEIKSIINSIQSEDIILFENIKSKCPGDKEIRSLNDLIIRIP